VWSARLERLCTSPGWQAALELAAVLGAEVRREEWVKGCAGLLPFRSIDVLLETLLEQRLVVSDEPRQGFSFVHSMLRESLLRSAKEAGRLTDLHRRCAALLQEGEGSAERIGLHLLRAGDRDASLAWLVQGAAHRRLRGDHARAAWLLEQRQVAADALGLAADDPRRMAGWICAARVAFGRGQQEQAVMWAARVESSTRRGEQPAMRSEALQILGRLDHAAGRVDVAAERLQASIDHARHAQRIDLEASAQRLLAGLYIAGGSLDAAESSLHAALALLGEEGSPLEVAMSRYALSGVAMRRSQFSAARDHAEAAWRSYEHAGHRAGAVGALNLMGEAAWSGGDLDAAEHSYREALRRGESLGAWTTRLPVANLGLLLITRRQFEAGRALLSQGIAALEQQATDGWAARLRICQLPCAVWAGDRAQAHACLAEAEALAGKGERLPEFVRVADIAAGLCQSLEWTGLRERIQAAGRQHGAS